ncbi:hypothetical protein EZH22_24600 [Xanthobacter dioxanivorans]|uniref:Uncharacterized protein n=1 Tax=Xanthobacter dioxanivorans TaxID=2528964 RepID=A0A974PM63_9HYPH|nr:hypothetical protein [Xanthobacter dioxanivorans]QRG06132.1 hypothetical protein EZH22_24600 [Xanthobacter dioxanivorans]
MSIDLLTFAAIVSSASAGALVTAAMTGRRNSALSLQVFCLRGVLIKVLAGLKQREARWSLERTIEMALDLSDEDEVVGDFTLHPDARVHAVGDDNV